MHRNFTCSRSSLRSSRVGPASDQANLLKLCKEACKYGPQMVLTVQFLGQNLHSKRDIGQSHAQTDISFLITWHLTHRCHKREFLFKFSKDRSRWIELLFEVKKHYQLSILNFIVTSNHIHLIVSANRDSESIPRCMQLIAGRSGQEYNRRKGRKGAFWEDRYHATAIESGEHLWRCLVYVDLNMVRVGVVEHPGQWKWSGYHEIQKPKTRYRLIDHDKLRELLNANTNEAIALTHRGWVESKLESRPKRQAYFSGSIAVGSEEFIKCVKQALGIRATGRGVFKTPASEYQLKETIKDYGNVDSDRKEKIR